MNSFQKWADHYARAYGFVVTLRGNWVELHKERNVYECLSMAGVKDICEKYGSPDSREEANA
jgi:hypothetical protein